MRRCLILLLCLNTTVFAQSDEIEETPDEVQMMYDEVWQVADLRQQELLQAAQEAWLVYRQANCELLGRAEDGFATCSAFLARERVLELRLLSRVLP